MIKIKQLIKESIYIKQDSDKAKVKIDGAGKVGKVRFKI